MRWHNGRSRRSRNLHRKMPAKAALLKRTRAQRIPFRPGDRYSNIGRIQSRRPFLSSSFFACKTAADHTCWLAHHSDRTGSSGHPSANTDLNCSGISIAGDCNDGGLLPPPRQRNDKHGTNHLEESKKRVVGNGRWQTAYEKEHKNDEGMEDSHSDVCPTIRLARKESGQRNHNHRGFHQGCEREKSSGGHVKTGRCTLT